MDRQLRDRYGKHPTMFAQLAAEDDEDGEDDGEDTTLLERKLAQLNSQQTKRKRKHLDARLQDIYGVDADLEAPLKAAPQPGDEGTKESTAEFVVVERPKDNPPPADDVHCLSDYASSGEEESDTHHTVIEKSQLCSLGRDAAKANVQVETIRSSDIRDSGWEFTPGVSEWQGGGAVSGFGRLAKQRHQIGWLAATATADEKKIQDASSKMRDAKRNTRAKYGW